MIARMPVSRRLACIITLAMTILAASPAQAVVDSATVVIFPNGAPAGGEIRSTSVTTVAIVSNPAVSKVSYIEIFGVTETGNFGLRIMSRDQRRIEAFYNQIVQAAAAHQEFQITVYQTGTFQQNGYVGDLDLGLNYFILF